MNVDFNVYLRYIMMNEMRYFIGLNFIDVYNGNFNTMESDSPVNPFEYILENYYTGGTWNNIDNDINVATDLMSFLESNRL